MAGKSRRIQDITPMCDNAMKVYQEFLDLMDEAVMAEDAETFLERVFLPHRLVTDNQTIVIEDAEAAARYLEGYFNALRSQRIDVFARVAKQARFDGPDCIMGTHDTFMTSGGKLVVPRFENHMTIVKRDGMWGSLGTRHLTRFTSWPDILPRGTPA